VSLDRTGVLDSAWFERHIIPIPLWIVGVLLAHALLSALGV
jgi:hypothetical protein